MNLSSKADSRVDGVTTGHATSNACCVNPLRIPSKPVTDSGPCHNLIPSMSAVGICADNASMEGFFGMLKTERVNRKTYQTRAEARADVVDD